LLKRELNNDANKKAEMVVKKLKTAHSNKFFLKGNILNLMMMSMQILQALGVQAGSKALF